ncbi:MAG TPA: RICIN domain-containing protein, partial [Ktedonobacteraceae bacterium]|nr:RICIN domain-containing protein [Ktedonobacteraceae bacterium]
ITPAGGAFSVTLQPGYVYTLTTTTGQGKGTITSPPPALLGLPYSENFAGYALGQEARYFADQNGAFEIAAIGGGRSGQCLRQMAPSAPITWDGGGNPYTIMGELEWTDYTLTCDVLLEQAGAAELLGRVNTQQPFTPAHINAYYLRVSNSGAWSLLKNATSGTVTTLQAGTVSALGTNTWHTLALTFQGSTISAKIDGSTVGTVTDSSYAAGQVGLGVNGWQNVQFANFSVTTGAQQIPGSYYNIVNVNSGLLLDVAGSSTSAGALIVQNAASGASSQQWQMIAASAGYVSLVNRNSGLVLDVPDGSTTQGTQLEQWSNNGGTNQQWQIAGVGGGVYTITARNSGLLADVSGQSQASGAAVIQWASNGGSNQQWQLVPVPTAGVTYTLINRNSGKVMDVSGGSTSNGGEVIQYTNHDGNNQQWRLVDAGGGYFYLVNVNSGLVLDVPGNSTTQGTQLDQWSNNGGANQQWQFVSAGGGYYTIVNRNSGYLVDVYHAETTDSAQIIQWASNGGTNQQWQLQPFV